MPRTLSVCLVAGEASGDAHGAHLVDALRLHAESFGIGDIHFWGSAGPEMRKAGVEAFVQVEDLAVMGVAEVVFSYLKISSVFKKLRHEIMMRRPDVVVCIDYPGFNLRLIQDVFAAGLTVFYHIPPKIWAHGHARVSILRDCTHKVFCILPFETHFYRSHGVDAGFVGNPLCDAVERFQKNHPAPVKNGERQQIGLLPGSRKMEILKVLPDLVRALVRLRKRLGEKINGSIPVASTLNPDWVREVAEEAARTEGVDAAALSRFLQFHAGSAYEVMQQSDYAWVCSGTATLETGFFGTPMGVVYRMNPLSYAIGKRLVKLPYISLVNLCAEQKIVPEFLQEAFTPENLVEHAVLTLGPEGSLHQKAELAAMREKFPTDSTRALAQSFFKSFYKYDLKSAQKFKLQKNSQPGAADGIA